jgi:putative transposase
VKTQRTTTRAPGPDLRPDLVERDFTAPAPNRLWVADITCVRTHSGWVYASFVMDVFSRRIVGWQL